jgi:hypothetical protein
MLEQIEDRWAKRQMNTTGEYGLGTLFRWRAEADEDVRKLLQLLRERELGETHAVLINREQFNRLVQSAQVMVDEIDWMIDRSAKVDGRVVQAAVALKAALLPIKPVEEGGVSVPGGAPEIAPDEHLEAYYEDRFVDE